MATTDTQLALARALGGLTFTGAETPYGLGASVLAQTTPTLINPYGSVGKNALIGLGGTLMTALLGYQAKKQAAEKSLMAQELGLKLAGLQSPEERLGMIKAVEDSDVQRKLLDVNAAIAEQNALAKALAAQRKQEAIIDFTKAGINQGLVNPLQLTQLITGTEPEKALVKPVIPTQEIEQKAESQLQQTTATGRPTISWITDQERATLSPYELKQREAQITQQKYLQEQYDKEQERKQTEQFKTSEQQRLKEKDVRTDLKDLRKDIDNDPITKSYFESKTAFKAARQLAEKDTIPATIALKKIAERVFNPGNQVTMQELGAYNSIMPIFEKYPQLLSSQLTGKSNLSPEARKELIAASEIFIDSLGKAYNDKVQNQFDFAQRQGLTTNLKDIAPSDLHVPRSQALEGLKAIEQRLTQDKQAITAGKAGMSATTKAALKAEYDRLKGAL